MAKRLLVIVVVILVSASAWAQQAPVEYKLSFPAPEHRWMQVEVRFPNVPAGPLQLRMARTSPGRYALHEFAKNVFDVVDRRTAKASRSPRPVPIRISGTSPAHDGTVVVTYKIFGDRTDGTYLGIDDMHAHINIPAALMFARGWFERPARVTFVQPPGKQWRVATQLFPTADPLVFTAPNIHYLMDSPTDFSNFMLREFTVDDGQKRSGPPPTFRIALTHDGTEAEADAFAKDVERIVRESIPDLRRAAELRDQHLHVPERLPAVGERRRHGAPQQHVADQLRRAQQSRQRQGIHRHRRARVLPRLEHGAAALGRRRAV